MAKVSLSTMAEYLKNSEQFLGIAFDFVNKVVIDVGSKKTVGKFNMLVSGKAWIEPVALVAIRVACENQGHGTISDKGVRDALTHVYYELAEAWAQAHPVADCLSWRFAVFGGKES